MAFPVKAGGDQKLNLLHLLTSSFGAKRNMRLWTPVHLGPNSTLTLATAMEQVVVCAEKLLEEIGFSGYPQLATSFKRFGTCHFQLFDQQSFSVLLAL